MYYVRLLKSSASEPGLKRPLTVSINRHNNLVEWDCFLIFHVVIICMVLFAIDFDCYPYVQQSEFEPTKA